MMDSIDIGIVQRNLISIFFCVMMMFTLIVEQKQPNTINCTECSDGVMRNVS